MDRTGFEPWKGKEVAKLLALVENQRRYYQDLISALPVGLVVLSAKRSVVSSNRAFRQAFEVRGEDLRGKSIEQLLPSDSVDRKYPKRDGPWNCAAAGAGGTRAENFGGWRFFLFATGTKRWKWKRCWWWKT